MTYTIIYEKISDGSMPEGYYYAYIPVLDITTHGHGIDGAKEAARDLMKIWIDEKRALSCWGNPSRMTCHGALDPTKMCLAFGAPRSPSRFPAGTQAVCPISVGTTEPQTWQERRTQALEEG